MKGTGDFYILYKKRGCFDLKVYIDADWEGNIDDRKSSGGAFFLGERLVTWLYKKHSCISQSSIEAKYVVVAMNYSNIIWIK